MCISSVVIVVPCEPRRSGMCVSQKALEGRLQVERETALKEARKLAAAATVAGTEAQGRVGGLEADAQAAIKFSKMKVGRETRGFGEKKRPLGVIGGHLAVKAR